HRFHPSAGRHSLRAGQQAEESGHARGRNGASDSLRRSHLARLALSSPAVSSSLKRNHMDLLRSPQADGSLPARASRPVPLHLSTMAHGPSVQEDLPAQYWKQLWRIKWFVAGCAVLGIGVGLLIAAFQTPIYRARTTLELQSINQNYLDMKAID